MRPAPRRRSGPCLREPRAIRLHLSARHETPPNGGKTRSAFGLATLSDSPAGRHGLMHCKVFKLCAGFQLFSQPNGLRSSSWPLIACLVAIFDRGLSTFQRTSLAPLSGADFTAQPRKLALQLVGPTAEHISDVVAELQKGPDRH